MKIDFESLHGKKIGIALSGGRDSMALFHALLSALGNENLVAIHCEHGIRPDSKDDQAFVLAYCKEHNVPCILFAEDCPQKSLSEKKSLETVAREFRYRTFDSLLQNHTVDVIATAHHLDDNAETVLFRLLRGSALSGLVGITNRQGYVRPLLSVSREEIDDYVASHNVPYREDSTNSSLDPTRNYLRHEVIPLLKEKFPSMLSSIDRFTRSASLDEEYLQSEALSLVDGNAVRFSPIYPLFTRACLVVMKSLSLTSDYTTAHLNDLFALQSKENGKCITLPLGIKAYREYDKITFTKDSTSDFCIPFSSLTLVPSSIGNGAFDPDKVPPSAVLRLRKNGDVFTPYNGKRKPFGEWLTDKKIPLKDRNMPVLADGNEILVVVGYEISDKVKITTDSKRICQIKYR